MKDWKEFLEEAKKHIPENIECEIKMISSINSLTRFANSHIHQNVEEEVGEIYLTIHKNAKTISLNSNITSIDSPKSFIEKALTEVDSSPDDEGWAGIPEKELSYNGYQEFESKNPEQRADKVKEFIEAGKDLNAAGYCSTSVDNYFVWNTNGLESSDSTTSAFIDGIFRTDTSSGSSHRGASTLEDIESGEVGLEAFELSKNSQNPEDIDPGKYEVVLGPEAVSTILVFLAVYGFNAKSKIEGTSPIQLNSQQFDEKLTLIDDPHRDKLLELGKLGIAKCTEVERTGCEGLATWLYEYINTIFLPDYGKEEAKRIKEKLGDIGDKSMFSDEREMIIDYFIISSRRGII